MIWNIKLLNGTSWMLFKIALETVLYDAAQYTSITTASKI